MFGEKREQITVVKEIIYENENINNNFNSIVNGMVDEIDKLLAENKKFKYSYALRLLKANTILFAYLYLRVSKSLFNFWTSC